MTPEQKAAERRLDIIRHGAGLLLLRVAGGAPERGMTLRLPNGETRFLSLIDAEAIIYPESPAAGCA